MPKTNPSETTRRRNQAPAEKPRGPSAVSLLFFWPFHLFNLLTRRFGWVKRYLLRLAGYPVVAALYGLLFFLLVYGTRARRFDLERIHEMPQRSIVRDRLNEEIGRIHGEKRSIVPLRQVAESFRKAILAREDERFYKHGAVDPIGIARATIKNTQGKREGASTITQQLVSDVFQLKRGEKRGDWPRQLDRKLLEIAIAVRLEATLEKDDILEAYINQINWGRQIKGVGEASRIYFEKHPSELTLSESALLAGIVRGPDSFNPFKSMEAATRERNTTLERMVNAEAITRAEADAAKLEAIKVRPMSAAPRVNRSPWTPSAAIWKSFSKNRTSPSADLKSSPPSTCASNKRPRRRWRRNSARSTHPRLLPPHARGMAAAAEDAREQDTPKYIQGAAVVVENRSGGVLAVVGGRDAKESRFNRAKDAKRQLGSIFKPFVYLSAFDKGLRPDHLISDGPIEPGEIKGGGTWRPSNSDGKYGGMMPVSYGLVRSRNTMSVRVGDFAGIPRVGEFAAKAGFSTPMPENPSSFLGSWEASPWEVATAFTIFPNDGARYRPYLISEIRDSDKNVLYSTLPLPYQAASSGSAWSVSRILAEVVDRGTAASIRRLGFDKPCAGKTGTTNDFKDAWFAGYTSSLTCAVWVGFDRPKKTIQGGFGSVLSLPVWVDIMKTADRLGYKAGNLHTRVNLVSIDLCRLSGKRSTKGCHEAGTAHTDRIPSDIVPAETDFCPIHPARATAVVDESSPTSKPPRAVPVDAPAPPPRALPVENRPPRAVPVE